MHTTAPAKYQEALTRATQGTHVGNYVAIYQGFEAKGIPIEEIQPRENVFTFQAWKALGRFVKRGEHGVKITAYVPMMKKREDGTIEHFTAPRTTTVFHISQTEPRIPERSIN
jgi:hypothetical protein